MKNQSQCYFQLELQLDILLATCDNKALWLFLLQNAIGDIFTRYRNENGAV